MLAHGLVVNLGQHLRRAFPPGTPINVLPMQGNYVAQAVALAGLQVRFLEANKWPFPDLISRLARHSRLLESQPIVSSETEYHNKVVNYVLRGLLGRPGRTAIKEVTLNAVLSQARADADIVAQSPLRPEDTPQVVIEIKTGPASDIRANQGYVYALALVGEHVKNDDVRLPTIGLKPFVPLPAMDFLLMDNAGPGLPIIPAFVRASEIDKKASLAQVMATLAIVRGRP